MMFCQLLGGAVFICVGNNIFQSSLVKNLAQISGINLGSAANVGATDLRHAVPVEVLPQVLVAYNAALRDMFYLVTGLACAMFVGAAAMEWKSVKSQNQSPDADQKGNQTLGGADDTEDVSSEKTRRDSNNV